MERQHPQLGILSKFRKPGATAAHGCALDVKMFIVGLKRAGSSRLPALITITSGITPSCVVTGAPQEVQKPRPTLLPLSPTTEWYLRSPLVSRNADFGTTITDAIAPPV